MDKKNEERYEFRTEASSKFWEPQVEGDSLTVRFGKIGTGGQTHTKKFSSPAKAEAEYRKLVCEKLAKGYKPTMKTATALLDEPALVDNSAAIASLCIGKHVPHAVAADICRWTTACIRHGMTPKQFKSVWNGIMEEENENLSEALGRTFINMPELSCEFWLDVTEWSEGELHELYAKAVESGGDSFIAFNSNAYTNLVALRGDPDIRKIVICVLPELNRKDIEFEELDLSDECVSKAPIALISSNGVTLRDGRRFPRK